MVCLYVFFESFAFVFPLRIVLASAMRGKVDYQGSDLWSESFEPESFSRSLAFQTLCRSCLKIEQNHSLGLWGRVGKVLAHGREQFQARPTLNLVG